MHIAAFFLVYSRARIDQGIMLVWIGFRFVKSTDGISDDGVGAFVEEENRNMGKDRIGRREYVLATSLLAQLEVITGFVYPVLVEMRVWVYGECVVGSISLVDQSFWTLWM